MLTALSEENLLDFVLLVLVLGLGMVTRERKGSTLKLTTEETAAGAMAGNIEVKREREQEREEKDGGSDELRKESMVVVLE